jgi:putative spermidine/putrescine transport system permease protein
VLPVLAPAIAAGSVFTFSLSLGDYITVQLVGGTGQMLGNLVYQNFSTDLPFAAAVAVLPLLVMAAYLLTIRRTGALDRL